MREARFTPGPWTARKDRDDNGAHHILAPDGWLVARVFGAANAEGPYGPYHPVETPQTNANAALIAAAPDLFEALSELVTFYEGAFAREGDMIARARAALAKVSSVSPQAIQSGDNVP